MSLKQYLILMFIGAFTSWVAFFLVLFLVNPETTSIFGIIFFYLSLFFALSLSFAMAGYVIRSISKKSKTSLVTWQIHIAFRQGIFFAIVVCGALFLSAHGLFSWLNLILLVLILTCVEFFLINKKNNI